MLEVLSEYLDGELPADTVALVQGHVAACDRCAQFGETFGAVVSRLRAQLQVPDALPADVAARLRARLTSGS